MARRSIIFGGCLLGWFLVCGAEQGGGSDPDLAKLPPPSPKAGLTFDQDIKPLFARACVECHGPKKAKGKVRLDSLEATLKSQRRSGIVPGDSARSKLVYDLAMLGDESEWMPPPNTRTAVRPLTREEIGIIRAWIDQGAR